MNDAVNALSQPEQRRSRRFRQAVEVDIIDKRGPRRGRAIDVARHGLFVSIADPPHLRHLVQLVLHLPDGPLQVAAAVSRTLPGQGVGLSLFAMSAPAKQRWDAFIILTQQSVDSAPVPRAGLSQPLSQAPAFVVKLKTMERLREYLQSHVAVGGTVLFTPVLPPAGAAVQLVVVHPHTEAEFVLHGRVHRAVFDAPKRLEILFEHTDMVGFARFVDSGQPPVSVLLPAPTHDDNVHAAPEPELDIDIAEDDEELPFDPIDWDLQTSDLPLIVGKSVDSQPPTESLAEPAEVPLSLVENDDDEVTAPVGRGRSSLDALMSEELVIDDAAPARDPGLRPLVVRVACETAGCDTESYSLELGPCTGVLALVADMVPFFSSGTDRIVSIPRLLSPDDRRRRFINYIDRGGDIEDVVSMSTFLAAADLAEQPRHPVTGELLRSSRAIERVFASARRAVAERARVATRVRCPHCATGYLTVEPE